MLVLKRLNGHAEQRGNKLSEEPRTVLSITCFRESHRELTELPPISFRIILDIYHPFLVALY